MSEQIEERPPFLSSRTVTIGFLICMGSLALDIVTMHYGIVDRIPTYLTVAPAYLAVLGARQWKKRHTEASPF
jgi:hypothetical protein